MHISIIQLSFNCFIMFENIHYFQFTLEADLKNNQTIKKLNIIWTNRKVETKLYLLPIGPNKFFE